MLWAEVLCMNGMTYKKTIPAASPQLSFERLSLRARRGGVLWAEQQSHSTWMGIVIWISMDNQNTFFPGGGGGFVVGTACFTQRHAGIRLFFCFKKTLLSLYFRQYIQFNLNRNKHHFIFLYKYVKLLHQQQKTKFFPRKSKALLHGKWKTLQVRFVFIVQTRLCIWMCKNKKQKDIKLKYSNLQRISVRDLSRTVCLLLPFYGRWERITQLQYKLLTVHILKKGKLTQICT